MNCRTVRRQMESGFKRDGYMVSGKLLEHVKSCESCSEFMKELELLKDTLNNSRLEVLPGELDDITFEKVISKIPETHRHPARISRGIKWLLAPAAVAVVTILIIFLARPGGNNVNEISGFYVDSYSGLETDNSLLTSDSISIEVLSLMAGDDASLDRVDDELLRQSDIDDMLSNLTPDELKALYDKIDNLKG